MTIRKSFLHLAMLLTVLLTGNTLAAQSAPADNAAKLTGKWAMNSVTSDGGSIEWALEIKQQDGALSGSVSSPDGVVPAKDFQVDGAKVHFKTTYNDEDYLIDLVLDGEKLTGKWSGNGDSGPTTGSKADSATPSK